MSLVIGKGMTVGELRAALEDFPDDMQVTVGYDAVIGGADWTAVHADPPVRVVSLQTVEPRDTWGL